MDSANSDPIQDGVKRPFFLMKMATVGKPGWTLSPVCLPSDLLPRQGSKKGRIGWRGKGKGIQKVKEERIGLGRRKERPQGCRESRRGRRQVRV